jgi:hypothetical protein
MNMNGEAVNAALALAGNQPLTEADRAARNSVYILCKDLYLSVLFTSLAEIDWRRARKHEKLYETRNYVERVPGCYYYEMPEDCVRPLWVDENGTDFRNDANFIITRRPAERLYYVFHKRNLNNAEIEVADTAQGRDNAPYFERVTGEETNDPYLYIAGLRDDGGVTDDDFPEWEYTDYGPDFWQYFSYKLGARLVPRLRADDGAAGRVQALEAVAARIGEEAIQRDKAASSSPKGQFMTWARKCGLESRYGGADYPRARYEGV